MTSPTEKTGACLCGAVHVRIAIKNHHVAACHCVMCRKWGGGPLLAIECDGAVDFHGTEHIAMFESSDWAERGFCRICGTHLFYRLKNEAHYALPVGLLDGDDDWDFQAQIFIDQKPAFYAFANTTTELTGEEVFAQYSDA